MSTTASSITDESFEELKREAIKIWKTYDDEFGYATEKINRINSIVNVFDNYGTIIDMFDSANQARLRIAVGSDNKHVIDEWTGGSWGTRE